MISMVPVVVTLLQGSLSGNGTEQGLRAMANLAVRGENCRLLGAAGACDGE